MKIDVQKFLAITALLAAGTAQACSSDPDPDGGDGDGDGDMGGDKNGDGDGDGDTGGNNGDGDGDGDGGMGGIANGGAGGNDGTGGTTAACVEDTSVADITCESLAPQLQCYTYAGVLCASAGQFRDAGFKELHTCLSQATYVDACDEVSPLHNAAVEACLDDVINNFSIEVCETPAAATLCSDIECDELADGECEQLLSLFADATTESTAADVAGCYANWDSTAEGVTTGCGQVLRDCVRQPFAD